MRTVQSCEPLASVRSPRQVSEVTQPECPLNVTAGDTDTLVVRPAARPTSATAYSRTAPSIDPAARDREAATQLSAKTTLLGESAGTTIANAVACVDSHSRIVPSFEPETSKSEPNVLMQTIARTLSVCPESVELQHGLMAAALQRSSPVSTLVCTAACLWLVSAVVGTLNNFTVPLPRQQGECVHRLCVPSHDADDRSRGRAVEQHGVVC
jgi:hypothetical protein